MDEEREGQDSEYRDEPHETKIVQCPGRRKQRVDEKP